MQSIKIISVGKLKEKHLQNAIEEYLKRLGPYAKITMEELPIAPFTDSGKIKAKKLEGEAISARLKKEKDPYVIFLMEQGGSYDTLKFSKQLDRINQPIVFVIAGPLGFDPEIEYTPNEKLSLSPLTFSHGLAKTVLLEQIFRAISISNGKKYHY